jgi:hypothetical protein
LADSQYGVYVGLLWAGVKRLLVAGVVLAAVAATVVASRNATRDPTKAEILRVETRTAVAASGGADVAGLEVIGPNRSFSLSIRVSHPARYLSGHVNRLVDVINRLTNVQSRFQHRSFTVLGPSGQVFWIDQTRTRLRETTHWKVRPDLLSCIHRSTWASRSNPYNAASPCPD